MQNQSITQGSFRTSLSLRGHSETTPQSELKQLYICIITSINPQRQSHSHTLVVNYFSVWTIHNQFLTPFRAILDHLEPTIVGLASRNQVWTFQNQSFTLTRGIVHSGPIESRSWTIIGEFSCLSHLEPIPPSCWRKLSVSTPWKPYSISFLIAH